VIGALVSITIQLVYQSGGVAGIVALWIVIIVLIGLYSFLRRAKSISLGNESALSRPDLGSTVKVSSEKPSGEVREHSTKAGVMIPEERACDSGPHKVSPGLPERIHLSVKKGDCLYGYFEETYGYDFNWFILDSNNLAKFSQGRGFTALEKGLDVLADSVEVEIPTDGPWYFVLDAYGKQHNRRIDVDLWKRRKTM